MALALRDRLDIQAERLIDKKDLWKAREKAMASVYKPWFPKVEDKYISSIQSSFKRKCIKSYSNLYNTVDHVATLATKVYVTFSRVTHKVLLQIPGFKKFEGGVFKVYNFFLPVNPVSGHRKFNICPRVIEKALGDLLISPSYLASKKKTNDKVGTRYIDNINQDILDLLKSSPKNNEILNPEGFVKFDYRVFSSKESVTNAFALPAGSLLVTSQIVQDLQREIERTQNPLSFSAIKQTTVTKADGSKVVVDLTGVELDDVIAALIGHEMTHAASRHYTVRTTLSYIGQFVYSALASVALYAMKRNDSEYQNALKNRHINHVKFEEMEDKYKDYQEKIDNVGDWIFSFASLYSSRVDEHEADVTGAYLAYNAGYNPLGALYLQEFLSRQSNMPGFMDFISTHPSAEKRKTAVYAALESFVPGL